MRISLRVKLLTGFFLLIAIPCAVLGLLSYQQAATALQNTIEEQLESMVQSAAALAVVSTESTQKLVEVAANDATYTTALNLGSGTAALSALQSLQQKNPTLMEDVILSDKNGQILASAKQGTSSNISIKDRAYFTTAISGKPVVSDVVISRTSGRASIIIAQPIRYEGQIVGVLAAPIDFSAISQKVADIKVGDTGYGYMIDHSGLVVYHPNTEMILRDNLLQNSNEDLRKVTQSMVVGNKGKSFYNFQNTSKLLAYAPAGQFSVAMTVPVAEYMAPAKAILRNTIIIMLIAIAIALSLAFFLARSIVNPVNELRNMMSKAGDGDLTVRSQITVKDEIGDLSASFNTMINHQNHIVREVRLACEQLSAASEEMAAASEQVTSTSSEISRNMQSVTVDAENGNTAMIEASQALVQLSSLIQIARSKATGATDISKETVTAAEEGLRKVQETINKMSSIKEQTQTTSHAVGELNQYSQQIGQIIDTITAIAAQTDLLALNAAIEAARAGEHGRGFAVVAEEVRKLAEQSHHGAQEITSLVHKVTEKTEQAVQAMEKNVVQVESGVTTVNAAGATLDRILDAVSKTVTDINSISEITAEEVASSDQIVKLIDQLSTVIENVAASTEEIASSSEQQTAAMESVAASAEETSAMANQLQNTVSIFHV